MSVQEVVLKQYQDKVDGAAAKILPLTVPPEGWVRTARKALGMSAVQLARRLGVTRGQISNIERGELEGTVTLKSLQTVAEALGFHLVYAIVPKQKIANILATRAQQKAIRIVQETHKQMELEDQALSKNQIAFEVNRLTKDWLNNMPSDFWDDKT
jgi:predicted DNA-binding mobile mystery protein A